jgi:hypothetical protein
MQNIQILNWTFKNTELQLNHSMTHYTLLNITITIIINISYFSKVDFYSFNKHQYYSFQKNFTWHSTLSSIFFGIKWIISPETIRTKTPFIKNFVCINEKIKNRNSNSESSKLNNNCKRKENFIWTFWFLSLFLFSSTIFLNVWYLSKIINF